MLYQLNELQGIIEKAIAEIPYPKKPEGLYEPISYVLSLGGKRVRPAYVLLSQQLFGGDVQQGLKAAVALEMFHNFTLLHDDLMDNANIRRGKPTVHKKWDANTAILSGDTMYELSYQMMWEAVGKTYPEAMQLFLATTIEVSEGQQYDMNFENRTDVSLAEYTEMIRLKTGVLIACALKLGAILGGASEAHAQLMYEYGALIGKAFQVQDDYLDVFGDKAVFGKPIGGDIVEGKKTFLLISALEKADADDKEEMLKRLASDIPAEEKIAYFTKMYRQLHIPHLCQETINNCFEQAAKLLQSIPCTPSAKDTLGRFTMALLRREK